MYYIEQELCQNFSGLRGHYSTFSSSEIPFVSEGSSIAALPVEERMGHCDIGGCDTSSQVRKDSMGMGAVRFPF
jgi:hypothetical protein